MSTYTDLPSVSFSVPFNKVSKIVWFSVQNTYGAFNVNFYITPSQTVDTNILIFNYSSKQELFKKIYEKKPTTDTITESVKIIHVPSNMSRIYGIKIS